MDADPATTAPLAPLSHWTLDVTLSAGISGAVVRFSLAVPIGSPVLSSREFTISTPDTVPSGQVDALQVTGMGAIPDAYGPAVCRCVINYVRRDDTLYGRKDFTPRDWWQFLRRHPFVTNLKVVSLPPGEHLD